MDTPEIGPAFDGMPLDAFAQFMQTCGVDKLRRVLPELVEREEYERCAVVRDLLAQREGKWECLMPDNTLAYYEVRRSVA